MIISKSDLPKAVSLLPFGYYAVTRLPRVWDLVFLIATSWIPATWLLYRLSDLSLMQSGFAFLFGYLAFLGVYEVGYLANDGWDTRRGERSRKRIPFDFGLPYVALFLIAHLGAWAAIGWASGWIDQLFWLAGYAVLVVAFAQHNLIRQPWLRITSFFTLATLRFVLPILGAIPTDAGLVVLVAAVIFYTYYRWLSYADSKDLMNMPERRSPAFGALHYLMLAPLALFIALVAGEWVLAELAAYFLVLFALWFAVGRR